MKIKSLHIYPIKGMRGISVSEALLQAEGLEYDRRWMLVNDAGTFISQRTHPELTKFIPSIEDAKMSITYNGAVHVVGLDDLSENHIDVTVFDASMIATEMDAKSSAWFSSQLGESVRLVKVSGQTNRIKDFEKYITTQSDDLPTETTVSFADGYPYLILGSASMDFLNSKMDKDLNIDRFRANIIVETSEPHVEDTWNHIQIGDQRLYVIKPCARCQVPTIDQQTGVSGKQPNMAMARYRRDGNKVNFGMNAVALTKGLIGVGDEVK